MWSDNTPQKAGDNLQISFWLWNFLTVDVHTTVHLEVTVYLIYEQYIVFMVLILKSIWSEGAHYFLITSYFGQ